MIFPHYLAFAPSLSGLLGTSGVSYILEEVTDGTVTIYASLATFEAACDMRDILNDRAALVARATQATDEAAS